MLEHRTGNRPYPIKMLMQLLFTDSFALKQKWSEWRESNPCDQLGKLRFYH